MPQNDAESVSDPRALFERVAVQVEPPADRMGYLPFKFYVYRGNAWASIPVSVEDLNDLMVDRKILFAYFERGLADKLSEYT